MEREEAAFKENLANGREQIESILLKEVNITQKTAERSEEVRKVGNVIFNGPHNSEDHEKILGIYNQSIAFAPCNSPSLFSACEDRCEFLYHAHRFDDCIVEINRLIKISNSNILKVKLLCSQVKCMIQMNQSIHKDILQEIQSLLDTIPESATKISLIRIFCESKSLIRNESINLVHKHMSNDLHKKEDILSSVLVVYNEKYGRHLIAKKDIKPGEVIFSEKLYSYCLNLLKKYTRCLNCLKTCWIGVPCDKCNWVMFCSEKCKLEAIENYHNVECTVLPLLENFHDVEKQDFYNCTRLLVMALEEAGSIDQLRKNLKTIDEMEKTCPKYLMSNGVENKFTTVYSLSSNMIDERLDVFASVAVRAVTHLAKYTQIFGENFNVKSYSDLETNSDFIFIGSLFLKLMEILEVNSHCITNVLSIQIDKKNEDKDKIDDHSTEAGYGLALVGSLINHSCIPNANRFFTNNNEIFYYAVKPIQKYSQVSIFDSYFGSFSGMDKNDRLLRLTEYSVVCDCQCCIHDWNLNLTTDIKFNVEEMSIFTELKKLNKLINDSPSMTMIKKIISDLSELAIRANDNLSPSSLIHCYFYILFRNTYFEVYDFESNVFKPCSGITSTQT